MSRYKLLDAFCKAGGATRGYQLAGFEVTGVDIEPQPNYVGDRFIQAEAVELIAAHWREYDAIHASPPCQAFTQMSARYRGKGGKADGHPNLLTPTLEFLRGLPIPWVVENVIGARRFMSPTVTLHGGMFGLGVHRPRLFESNIYMLTPMAARTVEPVGVYGSRPDGRVVWRNADNYRKDAPHLASRSVIRAARSIEQAREVMGIDWMNWDEIREAIPPSYTEWIGAQLLASIKAAA